MAQQDDHPVPEENDWELIDPGDVSPPPPPAAPAPAPAYSYHRHFHYGNSSMFCFQLSVNFGASATKTRGGSNSATILRGNYDTSSQKPDIAIAAIPFDEQPQSRLFSLPTELRLKIYEEVLYIPLPKVKLSRAHSHQHNSAAAHSVLSFLAVCQRARAESEPIFYSINNIAIQTSQISEFCSHVSLRRRESILSFIAEVSSGSNTLEAVERLAGMPNLRKLRIERLQSARFTNVREWAVLHKQIKNELGKMARLQELEIWTPETKGEADQLEQGRVHRLEQLDKQLKEDLPGNAPRSLD